MTPSALPLSARVRLARNLRRAREQANGGKGFSQTTVAARIGRTRQTVNRWEREAEASPEPGEHELAELAALYGTTVSALRYGDGREDRVRAISDPLPDTGRLWMAEFQVELLRDYGATDEEIAAALALVQSAEARAFMATAGGEVAPMASLELMADAVRAELGRRHRVPAQSAPLLTPAAKRSGAAAPGRHAQGGPTSRRSR